MNMEQKGDLQPKTNTEDWEVFRRALNNAESELVQMVENGEAYIKDKKDAKGRLVSFEIFSVDGTLLYFKDIEGLARYTSKLAGGN